MTEQHWNEFLEKLDFAQLTSRWAALPLHWLDDQPPAGLEGGEEALYQALLLLPKDGDDAAKEMALREIVSEFRRSRAAQPLSLPSSLTPPGSRVTLRYLDPEELGQGDCLITVGNWDRLGHFIAEKAGLADEASESSDNPVRKDPGTLGYRHLLIFPDKGSPSPRSFRNLCEKTLRQARGLGARRIAITHLHLPQPGLPDRFAAAELVSAIRQMLREGGGITVEILPLTKTVYEDYRHWFLSLAELSRGETETSPAVESPREALTDEPGEPILANTLRDLALKTSSLAQEASRGVSSWLRSSWEAASAPPAAPILPTRRPPVIVEPTFEEQQALNLLYLGRWKEAEAYRHCWEKDTLVGLYLSALYSVVAYIENNPVVSAEPASKKEDLPPTKSAKKKKKSQRRGKAADDTAAVTEEPQPPETTEAAVSSEPSACKLEYHRLREQLLSTASDLGVENPLARYFQLLAWRLDERRPDTDADQLEEDHARLLRAAWAWDDQALLTFLRSARQDEETEQPKTGQLGYVPVFPVGSRTAPQLD